MTWMVWSNTLLCLFGVGGGVFLMSGSMISIANMQVPWAGVLMVAAFVVPVLFAVAGVAGWVAYAMGSQAWLTAFMVMPWAYAVLFVLAMLATFAVL